MSVTSVFDIHLRPDSLPDAHRVVHEVADQTRAHPGNTGLDVLLDRTDPAHVVVIGSWCSAQQYAVYERWRHGDGAPIELSALLTVEPITTVCSTIPTVSPTTTSTEGTS